MNERRTEKVFRGKSHTLTCVCGARDEPRVVLCAVSFFTVLPCGMAIKQHCTGLSLHTEVQRGHKPLDLFCRETINQ